MEKRVLTVLIVSLIVHFTTETEVDSSEDDPTGHMLPLGSHRPSDGSIDQLDSFPDPAEFYKTYVHGSKPVLFKGAANIHPAYKLWSDEYLAEKYGDLKVSCEDGKKETREQNVLEMTLKEFLEVYDSQQMYMVQDVHEEMKVDLSVPHSLKCGGFKENLEMVLMWFSSGGTKSVLHHDDVDNINCILSGEKDMVMIDKKYGNQVKADHWQIDRGFSRLDTEKVDMYKFPQMRDVPWFSAHMDTGDCLFIPQEWYHAVDSSNVRNLAVNLWFSHLLWFNQSDCEKHASSLTDHMPLSQLKPSPVPSAGSVRSAVFTKYQHLEKITLDDMRENWEYDEEYLPKLFELGDTNNNNELSWEEVYTMDLVWLMKDIMENEMGEDELEYYNSHGPEADLESEDDQADIHEEL